MIRRFLQAPPHRAAAWPRWPLHALRAVPHNGNGEDPDAAMAGPTMTPIFRSREQAFWMFQGFGWLAYAAVRFFHGLTIGWGWDYIDTTMVATVTGFLLTTILRYLYRPIRNRPLAVVVAATILFCGLFALVFSAIEVTAVAWYDPRGIVDLGLFENAMFDGFVLLAWSGLYFGFNYYQQLQAQREATLKAAAMAHQAQLAMLRYQLNPHFLFNTLNAISTLVLAREVDLANRMLTKLAAFLRHTLVNEPNQKVTLEQELNALSLYLDIEEVRFEDRLKTRFDIEERARRALIPSLLLQPLIENAIKYAVAPREEGGLVSLSARIRDRRLELVLSDDGPGLNGTAVGTPGQASSGVGLKNTRARLEEIYGDDHIFRLEPHRPRGLSITISLPCEFPGQKTVRTHAA
ncbi:MAG: sensor histidine kinase [Alphaproteobacteria bacterium]|nr:MAG: sensor histidine kinase [Alphaproteobacteria bacterium]